jgi:hypothetical protein
MVVSIVGGRGPLILAPSGYRRGVSGDQSGRPAAHTRFAAAGAVVLVVRFVVRVLDMRWAVAIARGLCKTGPIARPAIIAAVRHPRNNARLLPRKLHFFSYCRNFRPDPQNLDDLLTKLRKTGDTVWLGEVS